MPYPPDDIFEQLSQPFHAYWRALGEFIFWFALVERDLQSLASHVAGLDSTKASAMFGNLRVDAAKDMITRLLDAEGRKQEKSALSPALDQLSRIARARNQLVHWGAQHDVEGYLVSNKHLSARHLVEWTATPDLLRAMCHDLWTIRAVIWVQIHGATDDPRDGTSRAALSPWQYKAP
jgi:hypothetical protein